MMKRRYQLNVSINSLPLTGGCIWEMFSDDITMKNYSSFQIVSILSFQNDGTYIYKSVI